MKFTSKRLISIMLVLAFALAMLPMAAFATSLETLYLVPNSNWLSDGARFAAVLATNGWSAQVWVDAVDSDADGVYEVAVPQDGNDYSIAIFCRMNPNATVNDWSNKWNQTSDLSIPTDGANCYTVEGGTWDNGNGTWSTFTTGDVVEPPVTPDLVIDTITAVGAGSSNFLYGIEWDPAASVNHAYDSEETPGVYTVSYNSVAAGSYEFKFAANDAWGYSWGTGAECVSGEVYDAYLNGNNSTVVVAVNNSTVTLTLDLTAMDGQGNGAKMSVLVEEPATSDVVTSAPGALVLGDNYFTVAVGDSSAISSTYTVEKDGVLSINPTAMSTFDAYTGEWSDIPAAYIGMQFGRANALTVNGEQVWPPYEMNVVAGDVVTIGFQSYMGTGTKLTINLSVAEPTVEVNYYVAGSAGLCGVEWDPGYADNMMVDIGYGCYQLNLAVYEAGTYEFKVTTGSWDTPSYGDANGNNMSVTVKSVASWVRIYFNAETCEITYIVEEWGAGELKFQLNADASANSESVDLRLITSVDSLDYASVKFYITINGETAEVACDTVYTAINANGSTLTCEDIFFYEGYLVTYTIEDIPAEYFGADIQVYAGYQPLDAEVDPWSTNGRTVVLSDILG